MNAAILGLLFSLHVFHAFSSTTGTDCGGNSNEQQPSQTQRIHDMAKISSELECSVTVDKNVWAKEGSIYVGVDIRNLSNKELDLKTKPYFLLKDLDASGFEEENQTRDYWSPVDLTGGSSLPVNHDCAFVLHSNELLHLRFDVTRLNWGRLIGAMWPSERFDSVVPRGRYQFYLEFYFDGKDDQFWKVRSNEVRITINMR